MTNSYIPQRIGRLDGLANNLWWSWHKQDRQLFLALYYPFWRMSVHNSGKQLHEASQDILQAAANDAAFLSLYDSVMSAFCTNMLSSKTRFTTEHSKLLQGSITFFLMEFAIHNSLHSLPIYAGGLGVLTSDICKEASDIGLPLVAGKGKHCACTA